MFKQLSLDWWMRRKLLWSKFPNFEDGPYRACSFEDILEILHLKSPNVVPKLDLQMIDDPWAIGKLTFGEFYKPKMPLEGWIFEILENKSKWLGDSHWHAIKNSQQLKFSSEFLQNKCPLYDDLLIVVVGFRGFYIHIVSFSMSRYGW